MRQTRPTPAAGPAPTIPESIAWLSLLVLAFAVPPATSNVTWLRHLPGVGDVSAFTADQFQIVKVALLVVLVSVGLGAWTWGVLTHGGVLRRTRADLLVLALVLWVGVATMLSIHRPTALVGAYGRWEGLLAFVLYGLIFFLTVQTLRTAEQVRRLVQTFVT